MSLTRIEWSNRSGCVCVSAYWTGKTKKPSHSPFSMSLNTHLLCPSLFQFHPHNLTIIYVQPKIHTRTHPFISLFHTHTINTCHWSASLVYSCPSEGFVFVLPVIRPFDLMDGGWWRKTPATRAHTDAHNLKWATMHAINVCKYAWKKNAANKHTNTVYTQHLRSQTDVHMRV